MKNQVKWSIKPEKVEKGGGMVGRGREASERKSQGNKQKQ